MQINSESPAWALTGINLALKIYHMNEATRAEASQDH
jgi:hypothetical protein